MHPTEACAIRARSARVALPRGHVLGDRLLPSRSTTDRQAAQPRRLPSSPDEYEGGVMALRR
ncbi:MAG: hypothetical protein K2W96_10985 [Gemmataceae bacterium]|nr:hypothetical protein [Gemmataceae bacterium]